MATLTDVGNVNSTILTILEQKGFQVWSDEPDSYWAEKDGWDFVAYSLAELLGLVSVYEFIDPKEYKEYWWKLDGTMTIKDLSKKERKYIPIYLKEKNEKNRNKL